MGIFNKKQKTVRPRFATVPTAGRLTKDEHSTVIEKQYKKHFCKRFKNEESNLLMKAALGDIYKEVPFAGECECDYCKGSMKGS